MSNETNQTNTSFNFDYRPLEQKVSFSEAKAEIFSSKLTVIGIVFCFTIVSILTLVAVPTVAQAANSPINGFVVFMVILAVVVVAVVLAIYSAKRHVRLRKFASVNGMTLLSPRNTSAGDYQGMIFSAGHSREVTEGFRMPGSQGFEIANFRYVTGSGKSSHTHSWGFVRIRLPKHLPNMVLDARANNLFSRFSNLPSDLRSNQKISLEGNFDSFFTLYAPQQYEIDARYIFTPDVMQYFIDHLKQFDVEIIDDSLYLYSRSLSFNKPVQFRGTIQIIVGLQQQLFRQSSRYTDDLAAMRPQSNGIALQGRRLKQSHVVGWVMLALFIILYVILYSVASGK